MTRNSYGGLFVTFDGPNGVGKSTIIECVQAGLKNCSVDVWTTKEPTDTSLGAFTRQIAETLDKESLTCLVAADRYNHLQQEIIPELRKGKVVVSDRYILSSLILQCMDGVDVSFILAVNDKAILPDIQIAVTANKDVIQSRLAERSQLARFERGWRTEEELKFLQKGKSILARLGVEVLDIENSEGLQDNVSFVIKHTLEAINK
jgi:dTMP kinase